MRHEQEKTKKICLRQ